MRRLFGMFIFIFLSLGFIYSQTIDTVSVFSAKMDRTIKNIVILPAGYNKSTERKYPVLYLLHGAAANYKTWLRIRPTLPEDADKLNMIVVCPDGENSWYWDSPLKAASQFETYISSDLVNYIDQHYNTIALPKGRAITGFSMGGHGALLQGIKHPDIFGACGSMSGVADIRPFPNIYGMKNLIGEYRKNEKRWDNYTVITQLDKLKKNNLPIIIDCGAEDEFFKVNEKLHEEMLEKGIAHEYIIKAGKHNRAYWTEAVVYQMQFFSKFFQSK